MQHPQSVDKGGFRFGGGAKTHNKIDFGSFFRIRKVLFLEKAPLIPAVSEINEAVSVVGGTVNQDGSTRHFDPTVRINAVPCRVENGVAAREGQAGLGTVPASISPTTGSLGMVTVGAVSGTTVS